MPCTEKPDGTKRVRLDPKDLNKNICREHYCSKTIDEIFHIGNVFKDFVQSALENILSNLYSKRQSFGSESPKGCVECTK